MVKNQPKKPIKKPIKILFNLLIYILVAVILILLVDTRGLNEFYSEEDFEKYADVEVIREEDKYEIYYTIELKPLPKNYQHKAAVFDISKYVTDEMKKGICNVRIDLCEFESDWALEHLLILNPDDIYVDCKHIHYIDTYTDSEYMRSIDDSFGSVEDFERLQAKYEETHGSFVEVLKNDPEHIISQFSAYTSLLAVVGVAAAVSLLSLFVTKKEPLIVASKETDEFITYTLVLGVMLAVAGSFLAAVVYGVIGLESLFKVICIVGVVICGIGLLLLIFYLLLCLLLAQYPLFEICKTITKLVILALIGGVEFLLIEGIVALSEEYYLIFCIIALCIVLVFYWMCFMALAVFLKCCPKGIKKLLTLLAPVAQSVLDNDTDISESEPAAPSHTGLPNIIYDSDNNRWRRQFDNGSSTTYANDEGETIEIYHANGSGNSVTTNKGTFHWYT